MWFDPFWALKGKRTGWRERSWRGNVYYRTSNSSLLTPGKYIWQFGQIHFSLLENTSIHLDKYNLQFGGGRYLSLLAQFITATWRQRRVSSVFDCSALQVLWSYHCSSDPHFLNLSPLLTQDSWVIIYILFIIFFYWPSHFQMRQQLASRWKPQHFHKVQYFHTCC